MCISIDHSDSQQVSIYLAILASAHVTRNSKMADEKQILDKYFLFTDGPYYNAFACLSVSEIKQELEIWGRAQLEAAWRPTSDLQYIFWVVRYVKI